MNLFEDTGEVLPDAPRYYHGTSNEKWGKAILKMGLKPQSHADMNRSGRGALHPVENMTYLTPSLCYAIIYALGGNMLGHSLPDKWIEDSRYGYLFVVDGASIKKRQPDEDEIGSACRASFEVLYKDRGHISIGDNPEFEKALQANTSMQRSLVWLAQAHLTDRQQTKLFHDFQYDILAIAGKKMVKVMSEKMKQELVDMGCHIASADENITPIEAWKIDRKRSKDLDYHGANFFDIAKRVR